MTRLRSISLALLAIFGLVPAALAQFVVNSPTTDWVGVPYGPNALGDIKTDQQTGLGESDIVGNTGTLATSLPSFYFKYVSGGSSTNGTIYYRVRLGGDSGSAGFKSVALIGLDANKDGKLDLFMGVNNSGQANGIYIWKAGTGLNISPSTTSMQTKTPVKFYTETATNYHWGSVTSNSATVGVALDSTANTALRQDFDGATGTDYMVSFSIPFQDLVAALSTMGISYNSSQPITYVMGTSAQPNAFNQDLNGVTGATSSTLTWGALGVLTQPISPTGTVTNVAPVNTVPGSRTANGSLALTGVSVDDADGNLATVLLTSTNGTLNVSLTGGAQITTGANASASMTLGGTKTQINAALATLGFTPTLGYTGAASATILSTDTGGLTDQDTIAITVVSGANTTPTANADTATTHSGKPVNSYIIGNDVDPDGNVLTITAATLTSGQGTVSYANGTITYTPTTSYVGTAVINYTISDGFGGTASSTLTISVSANNAPVANNDAVNANPNATIFISPLTNDTDANGDPLSITSATRATGNGTVTVVGTDIQFDAPNQNGTTTITYNISDGFGGTATATITVTIGSNTAPVALADVATATSGSPVDANVLANDTDLNGDPLTISDAVMTTGSGTVIAVDGKVRFTPAAGFTGVATITYTIDDGRGGTASALLTVTVTANSAPSATGDSYTVAEDVTLTVNVPGVLSNDSDPNGNMITATLISSVSHGSLTLNADGSFTYTPTANYNGSDSFTYQATDGSLNSSTVTVSITVTPVNDLPSAGADSYSVNEDATLTVTAPGVLSDDIDVDGTPLTAVQVSGVSHGSLSLNANGAFTYTPTANYNGPDSFTYKANDGTVDSNTVTVSITVNPLNDGPVAVADGYSVVEDGTLSIAAAAGVLLNDTDPEGNPLTAALVSNVSHGTLSLNADGSFTYTPTANYNGPDSFTYKANDGAADSNTVAVTLNVTAVNDAPAGVADSYTVAEDASLSISTPGVLGNDTDAEGDTLTAVLFSGVSHGSLTLNANGSFTYTPAANYYGPDSFSYRANDGAEFSNVTTVSITVSPVSDAPVAVDNSHTVAEDGSLFIAAPGVLGNDSDADGDTLTAVLVSDVSHGTLTLNSNGSFTYVPAANYHGADSFTYKANDGTNDSNVATVSLTVSSVNDAPVALANSYTVAEDGSLTISPSGVLGNDTDADGDSLTAALVSDVSHGSLTLNGDGSFTYTPTANYSGPDSFTYKANDGTADSASVTVSITVTPGNDSPVATADGYSIPQGGTLNTDAPGVLANDTDPEGAPLTAILVSTASNGVLSLNSDGAFVYIPAPGYTGPDSFTYKANDGIADSAITTVSIVVSATNSAPVATADNYTITSGTTLTVAATGVLGNDSDPDGNSITAIVVTDVSHGTASLNGNGSFSYTPEASFTGSDSFTYRVTDGSLTSSVVTVSITVTAAPAPNRPPVLTAPSPLATTVTTPIDFTIITSDPDSDPVTVTFGTPKSGAISGAGPQYTYTPQAEFAGVDAFTVTASDGHGGTVTRTVKVNVTAEAAIVGNYSILLHDDQGEVAGHIMFTASRSNRAIGTYSMNGIHYNARAFIGGAPRNITARVRGAAPVLLGIATDHPTPGRAELVVSVTEGTKTYVGRAARSPYSRTNPAPQTGRYTIINSRQQLVLDRTNFVLPDATATVPAVASALTVQVTSGGSVRFRGSAGHGFAIVCSSYVMEESKVPYHADRRAPGFSVQYADFNFPADLANTTPTPGMPAIWGSLRWAAGADRRIATPFDATYAVLGARFTPQASGEDLLNASELTLTLTIPSYADEGLSTTYTETRAFTGNQLPRESGNITAIRPSLTTGSFLARMDAKIDRPFFGVIIQGEGIDLGLGAICDWTDLGTCELRP